jgi:hypothetical protein
VEQMNEKMKAKVVEQNKLLDRQYSFDKNFHPNYHIFVPYEKSLVDFLDFCCGISETFNQ